MKIRHFFESTETMSLPTPQVSATQIAYTTTGKYYWGTTFICLLRGAIKESLKLSAEIDRRICADWMSLNRYRTDLYDRLTASLTLKALLMASEVVEALMYI